jgi:ubiquinone biosynthesis UbiH/UbiF/VisC/COQ6 family hydroxylase
MQNVDVLVRGAGAVGQCLALALARIGLRVALGDEPASAKPGGDVRAYALNAASAGLLRELKVWQALPPSAVTAVHEMRVHGDAPGARLEFNAWQQQVDALAWIVDAQALHEQLEAALRFAPQVLRVALDVHAPPASPHGNVPLTALQLNAPLTALCEGKHSATRAALGVRAERHDFGQKAIAARLTATRDHQHVARQWFRSPDVLALLPLDAPKASSSYALVWSCPTARADELLHLSEREFEIELMQACGTAVGELQLCSPRMAWPLVQMNAQPWCGPGWVLLGDAAHVVHPLAGQGLNLGLADVAALSHVLAQREPWRELGDERLLRRYARSRAAPTWAMSTLTGGLLQLFSHPAPAVRELRNRGLTLVNHLSPVKRWLNTRATHS